MPFEIERKYLIPYPVEDILSAHKGLPIKQAYINTDPEKTIRVRIYGEKGFFTLKGRPQNFTRPEYEYEIPYTDALEMIDLFAGPVIEKRRFQIPFEGHIWEVDIFEGENAGLQIAEIELPSEETLFTCPDWIGQEVSLDPKYANSQLQVNPYKYWKNS